MIYTDTDTVVVYLNKKKRINNNIRMKRIRKNVNWHLNL